MNALTNTIFIKAANHFGTPLYLYHFEKIKQQYDSIQTNLMSSCSIFYSMKANPSVGICQYLHSLGSHCEVSSEIELLTAIKAGFLPKKIIFVGPVKKINVLTLCIHLDIFAIICESLDEINSIHQLAKNQCKKMRILLRINPDFTVTHAPLKMSGVASQFGIDLIELSDVFIRAKQLDSIKIEGIQIYNATRILNTQSIINNVEKILMLADRLSQEWLFEWNHIDIGGGFGIPYFEGEENLDSMLLTTALNRLFDEYQKKHASTQFMMELGRYLVAESGYLIATIQSIKSSHGKQFAISDAGMHCFLASSTIASFVHRNFPYQFISKNAEREDCADFQTYHVTGALCTPGDIVLRSIQSHPLHPDDLLILKQVGAYGLTASPSHFLSHGAPAEVGFLDAQFHLLRQRETAESLWSLQTDLDLRFQKQQEVIYV